ncbi:LacI family transcriptional regulator [Tessaracoccus sp. OS52]|uniref:LacI family DNA-binding transcriptional regulator n=1 Tax=Tessaracoccus sp. OS52 TaxID=2886691 RepID=UPI001D12C9EC|nr:LacI family DNA-binding transcriptional regulator [Tessaracoccus sp. OS52]MCC2593732.1 LacI family transcriptional regulator [Tessaracoccus sp. OS52]
MSGARLRDVANAAGVSLATASRVLSGSDYPVKEDLRLKVEEAATALDYIPNAQAQGLLLGNPGSIGVLVGDVGDPYFSGMIAGIHHEANKRNYMVTVLNTQRDPIQEIQAFRTLQAQRVGMAIIAGSGLLDETYRSEIGNRVRAFSSDGLRTAVLIGRHEVDVPASRILVDNVSAGRQVGEHLASLGHRDVALLAGDPGVTSTVDRITGIREVLGDGVHVHPALGTRDAGYAAAAEVMAEHPRTTAIVGTADQMAIGAMVWLRDNGYDVPGQVSVVGCNDIWVCRDLTPALTTVALPLHEMGVAALKIGVRARTEGPIEEHFEPKLVVRDSTGPVRNG